jgi:hypothetical protein
MEALAVGMVRTFVLFAVKMFYPIIRLVADIYFWLVELIFYSRNNLPFCAGKELKWPDPDDPLLCVSAKQLAGKIRSGIVKCVCLNIKIYKVVDFVSTIGPDIHRPNETGEPCNQCHCLEQFRKSLGGGETCR